MATFEETDAFFAHHGVLGMHWGVRKKANSPQASSTTRKVSRKAKNAEILNARGRQLGRVVGLNHLAGKSYSATTEKGRKAATNAYAKAEKEYLTNPDAAMASKMTSGEKWVTGITWGAVGVGAVGYVAAALNSRP